MTRVTYTFSSDMKHACRPAHNTRSETPNIERVLLGRHLLPYFPTTYGWVTTRALRACLLERWKSGDGRAWEISSVALTSVSDGFGRPPRRCGFHLDLPCVCVCAVYECVVRTKEVNGRSCSGPVRRPLVSSMRVTLVVEMPGPYDTATITYCVRWNRTMMADRSW